MHVVKIESKSWSVRGIVTCKLQRYVTRQVAPYLITDEIIFLRKLEGKYTPSRSEMFVCSKLCSMVVRYDQQVSLLHISPTE